MNTPEHLREAWTVFRRNINNGAHWTVTTPSGHLIGLLSQNPYDSPTHRLRATVRAATMTGFVEAGWVLLGEVEEVPEYEGRRPGLGWEPGRVGCRLVVTEAGRGVW